jgi:exodeoxyribonuclease VII large subunit
MTHLTPALDEFPGASATSAIAVSTLTETAKDVLEGAFIPLWVRGEVTDFKAHRNGHWYFCLRDRAAQIRCVVWKRDQRGIPAAPDEGMQVAALGRLTVYAARGEMQFSVTRMEAEGDGLRRKALEITRARLEADGLLSPSRKRPLPRIPRTIAVVTSPDGAALHDVIAVLRKRRAGVRVVLVPAAVQGESATHELCAALDRVARWGEADVVIFGRGGGSREDLWAFNDETVARALAACPIPTICAVGHEIDISICDLVADLRAATPSAAAEAAIPSRDELASELRRAAARVSTAGIRAHALGVERMHRATRRIAGGLSRRIEQRRANVAAVAGRLHALSPMATLARGYAIARDPAGQTLASATQFADGTEFELILRDCVVAAAAVGTPQVRGPQGTAGTPP